MSFAFHVAAGKLHHAASEQMHHCRLAFIIDKHVVDDFAFVVTGNGDSNNLLLLGENHFAFAQKWRNGLLPVTKTPS